MRHHFVPQLHLRAFRATDTAPDTNNGLWTISREHMSVRFRSTKEVAWLEDLYAFPSLSSAESFEAHYKRVEDSLAPVLRELEAGPVKERSCLATIALYLALQLSRTPTGRAALARHPEPDFDSKFPLLTDAERLTLRAMLKPVSDVFPRLLNAEWLRVESGGEPFIATDNPAVLFAPSNSSLVELSDGIGLHLLYPCSPRVRLVACLTPGACKMPELHSTNGTLVRKLMQYSAAKLIFATTRGQAERILLELKSEESRRVRLIS